MNYELFKKKKKFNFLHRKVENTVQKGGLYSHLYHMKGKKSVTV